MEKNAKHCFRGPRGKHTEVACGAYETSYTVIHKLIPSDTVRYNEPKWHRCWPLPPRRVTPDRGDSTRRIILRAPYRSTGRAPRARRTLAPPRRRVSPYPLCRRSSRPPRRRTARHRRLPSCVGPWWTCTAASRPRLHASGWVRVGVGVGGGGRVGVGARV